MMESAHRGRGTGGGWILYQGFLEEPRPQGPTPNLFVCHFDNRVAHFGYR